MASARTLRLLALLCALASSVTSLRVTEFTALALCGSGDGGCCGSDDGACCCAPEASAPDEAFDPWATDLIDAPPPARDLEPSPVARSILCGCGDPHVPAAAPSVSQAHWLASADYVLLDLEARRPELPRGPRHARHSWQLAPEPPPPRCMG
ncbi:MAG: hypothetical protein DHS20C15_34500 [Planctomycetota bacterium]|nr:MAG: hypothetical protein DHS20C15_34500 [Planctomycetota bacterium]